MKPMSAYLFGALFLGFFSSVLVAMNKELIGGQKSTAEMSVEEFRTFIDSQGIVKVDDLLISLLCEEANNTSRDKINIMREKIDSLDPLKSKITYENASYHTLLQNILYYHSFSPDLSDWIAWFVRRGFPIDTQDGNGQTALISAIYRSKADKNYVDIIKILLANGANTRAQNKHGDTPLTLIDRLYHDDLSGKNQILMLLTQRPSPVPTISVSSPATSQTPAPPLTTGTPTSTIISTIELPSPTIAPALAPSSTKTRWNFTRSHAALTAVATTIGLLAIYNWFTSKKQAVDEYKKNVLINTTGKAIWIAYNYDTNFTEVANGAILDLPDSVKALKIKASEKQPNSSALSVKLDALAANRTTHHLNITVYKRSDWTSWWFGPLGASVKLVPMQ